MALFSHYPFLEDAFDVGAHSFEHRGREDVRQLDTSHPAPFPHERSTRLAAAVPRWDQPTIRADRRGRGPLANSHHRLRSPELAPSRYADRHPRTRCRQVKLAPHQKAATN